MLIWCCMDICRGECSYFTVNRFPKSFPRPVHRIFHNLAPSYKMKLRAVILLFLLLATGTASAQLFGRRHKNKWPATEAELMHKLLGTMSRRDTAGYFALFPPFDTLWSMVMRNNSKDPAVQNELNNLRQHPQMLIEFDPLYNRDIMGRFANVLGKGEDSGITWRYVVMARYELYRQEPSRAFIGLEHIMPERFNGYMFVSDGFNRLVFCVSVAEIQKIKGQFFGGQVLNILQASSVDEFRMKEQREKEWFEWVAAHPDSVLVKKPAKDTTAGADTTAEDDPLALSREEDDEGDMRKNVVDRKYYEGLMDNEIPIRMYVRYMKPIPGRPQQFDGLYKLGDNRKYVRLEINRTEDGRWIIEDENFVGTMELKLTGRTYTGAWTNADENGFDVEMTQKGTVKGKIETLDAILDQGLSGRVDESQFEEEEEAEKAKDQSDGDKKKDGKKERKKDKKKKERKKKNRKERKMKRRAEN